MTSKFIKNNSIKIIGCFLAFMAYGISKPNVIFIFADQMRAEAMANRGNTMVKTPHLDALADQGLISTHSYAASPVCTPYRAQVLTGRHFWHTGVHTNDVKLPAKEYSMAEAFKDNGYYTGFIGKWHLNAGRRSPGGTAEAKGWVAPEDRQGFEYWSAIEVTHVYMDSKYFTDSKTVLTLKGYEPVGRTTFAFEFIEKAKAQSKPFMLVLSYGPPHNPYPPPAPYDIYKDADVPLRPNVPAANAAKARGIIADYYGLVTSLDTQIGRIMKYLDDNDLTKNTILVFSSDHGDMLQSHSMTLKQRPFEEAANIPFIIRYPDKIPAGQKTDLLVSSIDMMPTLLGFAGITIPDNIDGKNLVPQLTGKSKMAPQYLIMANHPHTGQNEGWSWRAIRDKDWKYGMSPKGGWFLYNIKEDPYEMNNLIEDPKYQYTYSRLDASLRALLKASGDTMTMSSNKNPPVYPKPVPFDLVQGCMDTTSKSFSVMVNLHIEGSCDYTPIKDSKDLKGIEYKSGILKFPFDKQHTLYLMDMNGKEVFKVSGKNSGSYQIPDKIKSGVYTLKSIIEGNPSTSLIYVP